MLTYTMENRGAMPLYEYLYRCIREDILSGKLAAGERLPSKRSLAEHLQISVITVESAYDQLVAEGYVYTESKRGFFVAQVEQLPAAPGKTVLPETEREQEWRVDLRSSRVDGRRFPAETWARLTRQILSESRNSFLQPLPHQGLRELRQAIAADLRDFRGMSVAPEQIVIGAGAEHLYLLLAQLLGKTGAFALEDPGYEKIRLIYGRCGIACRAIPMDQQGMSVAALEKTDARVAHISPSHHYPTGIITTIGRRQALLRWAETVGGVIIEDDYDSEFRFTGRPIPTLQSIDSSGCVIYMNTFSKTISPSMRVGFMVLPPKLLARYRAELGFYACAVPALEQYVLARFLAGGHYEKYLSRMKKEYRLRRAAVLEAFRSSPFADRITIMEQGAGLHFLLQLDTERSEEELRRRAEEKGVRLSFLSDHAAAPSPLYARTLVINYAGLETERLGETVALLAEIFAEETE